MRKVDRRPADEQIPAAARARKLNCAFWTTTPNAAFKLRELAWQAATLRRFTELDDSDIVLSQIGDKVERETIESLIQRVLTEFDNGVTSIPECVTREEGLKEYAGRAVHLATYYHFDLTTEGLWASEEIETALEAAWDDLEASSNDARTVRGARAAHAPSKPRGSNPLTWTSQDIQRYYRTAGRQSSNIVSAWSQEVYDRGLGQLSADVAQDPVSSHDIMDRIDELSGMEFEEHLRKHFEALGYHVDLTPVSGDFGADLVLEHDGRRTVVQVKRWSGPVGLGPIQEVRAAFDYYDADAALFVTSGRVTPNARKLAHKVGVEIWDRDTMAAELGADLL